MDATRQKLLALVGDLIYAEEPSGDSGGGAGGEAPSTDDSGEESTGGGGREDGDEEDSDEDEDRGGDGFKPITSQDEFERILGKRLQRERAKFADYDDLKSKVADQEATIADLREKLGESTLKDLRKSIADEAGIPENLLRGTTEEELKAHAEDLKAAFSKTEEDEQVAARRSARSPHTGTGGERPAAPSQEQGRERARALLTKNNRKDQV